VICLEIPDVFYVVGAFFLDFSQVSDEEASASLAALPVSGCVSARQPPERR